jgi:hypothetical protein
MAEADAFRVVSNVGHPSRRDTQNVTESNVTVNAQKKKDALDRLRRRRAELVRALNHLKAVYGALFFRSRLLLA